MKLFRLIFLSILLLISCNDSLNITGITETDESGPNPLIQKLICLPLCFRLLKAEPLHTKEKFLFQKKMTE
jgi:hypothetical protein